MGRVLCFIYDNMADFEITFSCELLKSYGKKEITTMSYDMNMVKGTSGIQYQPEITVKEAFLLKDVEALIIPGGWNTNYKQEIFELIQKLDEEKKLLCSICAGPQYFARADILEGRLYTTNLGSEYLESIGMEDPFPRDTYVDKNVVRDENIITAKGNAFIDFAMEIFYGLNLFESEQQKEMFTKHYKGIE